MASLIGTWGTVASANADAGQPKIFYDGAHWWYFYMKSTSANTLFYAWSSDLASWTESSTPLNAGTLQAGNSMAVLWDQATSVVLVTFQTTGIQYVRGVVAGTSITWAGTGLALPDPATLQSFDADYNYQLVKDSTGKIVALYQNHLGSPWWARSTNVISPAFADSGASWSPSERIANYNQNGVAKSSLFARSSGGALLALAQFSASPRTVNAHIYNGTSWSAGGTVPSFGTYSWGACQVNDASYYVIYRSGINSVGLSWSADGVVWSAKTPPLNRTNGQYTLVSDGTDMWAIVVSSQPDQSIEFNKYTVGADTWGGWTDIEGTSAARDNQCAVIANGLLVATWKQTNGANFDAYNGTLIVGTPAGPPAPAIGLMFLSSGAVGTGQITCYMTPDGVPVVV